MIKELFSKLEAYINGSLSRADFSVWFYGYSRVAEKRFHGEALEFIRDVEGIIAESSSGGWSEFDLKDELEDAIERWRSNVVHFNWDYSQAVRIAVLSHLDFGHRQV